MTTQELIQWSIENNMNGFITRYRDNILKLVNDKQQEVANEICDLIIEFADVFEISGMPCRQLLKEIEIRYLGEKNGIKT